MKDVKISIRRFKAVNKADIFLNGITVLSGINGSGKSTISRLLYYTFKYANEFESIVKEAFEEKLEPISALAFRLSTESRFFEDTNEDMRRLYHIYRYEDDIPQSLKEDALLTILKKGYEILNMAEQGRQKQNRFSKDRYIQIIKNVLNTQEEKSLQELFSDIISYTKQTFAETHQALENRDYSIFKHYVENKFNDSLDSVQIDEYGYSFVGKNVKNIPIMEYIQQVAYIDTPVIVGIDTPLWDVDYWEHLDSLLKHYNTIPSKTIFDNQMKDIIHGKAVYDEDAYSNSYKYNREDGKIFNLFESATGIKSFSILQMLLSNGFINKNTLLIIDEPEAHLHPQWIVEYARLIVLIHKLIGTKFFIASHSTDFVSAIKYIATKEECLSSLSYYLSEEDTKKKFTYNYRSLGQNIEPIFESFNKSFELIDKYGTDND